MKTSPQSLHYKYCYVYKIIVVLNMLTYNLKFQDRSPSPGIKSTAVVKYTAFQSPVGYARLQCNTDLNMPPSNWGAAIDSYGLKQILTRGTGFSR